MLLLESLDTAKKRNAEFYAEILGYGVSCDAFHMTSPSKGYWCFQSNSKIIGESTTKI